MLVPIPVTTVSAYDEVHRTWTSSVQTHWINPAHVAQVVPDRDGGCLIVYASDQLSTDRSPLDADEAAKVLNRPEANRPPGCSP